MSATTMLALAQGTQAAASAGSAYSSAKAITAKAGYQVQQQESNAQLADLQADDATRRGEKEAQAASKRASKTIGEQRVAAASQGLDPNSGAALDAQAETTQLSAIEQQTIRNNAWRESFGHKVEAQNDRGAAVFTEQAAKSEARNTIATGGLQFFAHAAEAGAYLAGDKKAPGAGETGARGPRLPVKGTRR